MDSGSFSGASDALQSLFNVLGQAQQTYQACDLKETVDHLYWIIASSEFAYYQDLQSGNVNPNGATVPGVDGFLELDGSIAYMAGVVDDHIRNRVAGLLTQQSIRTVVMVGVPDSNDYKFNTAVARQKNRAGVQTHLIIGGDVEPEGS